MTEFQEFAKIPRLMRGCVITEKLDGTNAQVFIPEDPAEPLLAGSRNRWLEPTIVVWHEAAQQLFKRTLGSDGHKEAR